MIDGEHALFVIIEQVPCGPPPYPLEHGFTGGAAYRVLAVYRPVDSRETWLLLSNDYHQLRYIALRHARRWSATPTPGTVGSTMIETPARRAPDWYDLPAAGSGHFLRM